MTRLTPVQEALTSVHLLLEDTREELTPSEWAWFVWIAQQILHREAAALVVRPIEELRR